MKPSVARLVARLAHGDQMYSGEPHNKPYIFHLDMVVTILKHHGYPDWSLCAGYLHDVLEDCSTVITYADIECAFGKTVADVVESCTGRGANRKARQANIHHKLELYAEGRHVKLADRMANIHMCLVEKRTGLLEMYLREHPQFMRLIQTYVTPPQREDYLQMVKEQKPLEWLVTP